MGRMIAIVRGSVLAFASCMVMLYAAGKTTSPGAFQLSAPSLVTSDLNGNLRVWDFSTGGLSSPILAWGATTTFYRDMAFGDVDADGKQELITTAVCASGRKTVTYQTFVNVYKQGAYGITGYPGLWATTFYSAIDSIYESPNGVSSIAVGDLDGNPGDEVIVLTNTQLSVLNFAGEKDPLGNPKLSLVSSLPLGAGVTGRSVLVGRFTGSPYPQIIITANFGIFDIRLVSFHLESGGLKPDSIWPDPLDNTVNLNPAYGKIRQYGDSIWTTAMGETNTSLYILGISFDGKKWGTPLTRLVAEGIVGPRGLAVGDLYGNSNPEIAVAYTASPDGSIDKIEVYSLDTEGQIKQTPDTSRELISTNPIVLEHIEIADLNLDDNYEIIVGGRCSASRGTTYLEVFNDALVSLWKRTNVSGEGELSALKVGN